jgi:hypothetical protein
MPEEFGEDKYLNNRKFDSMMFNGKKIIGTKTSIRNSKEKLLKAEPILPPSEPTPRKESPARPPFIEETPKNLEKYPYMFGRLLLAYNRKIGKKMSDEELVDYITPIFSKIESKTLTLEDITKLLPFDIRISRNAIFKEVYLMYLKDLNPCQAKDWCKDGFSCDVTYGYPGTCIFDSDVSTKKLVETILDGKKIVGSAAAIKSLRQQFGTYIELPESFVVMIKKYLENHGDPNWLNDYIEFFDQVSDKIVSKNLTINDIQKIVYHKLMSYKDCYQIYLDWLESSRQPPEDIPVRSPVRSLPRQPPEDIPVGSPVRSPYRQPPEDIPVGSPVRSPYRQPPEDIPARSAVRSPVRSLPRQPPEDIPARSAVRSPVRSPYRQPPEDIPARSAVRSPVRSPYRQPPEDIPVGSPVRSPYRQPPEDIPARSAVRSPEDIPVGSPVRSPYRQPPEDIPARSAVRSPYRQPPEDIPVGSPVRSYRQPPEDIPARSAVRSPYRQPPEDIPARSAVRSPVRSLPRQPPEDIPVGSPVRSPYRQPPEDIPARSAVRSPVRSLPRQPPEDIPVGSPVRSLPRQPPEDIPARSAVRSPYRQPPEDIPVGSPVRSPYRQPPEDITARSAVRSPVRSPYRQPPEDIPVRSPSRQTPIAGISAGTPQRTPPTTPPLSSQDQIPEDVTPDNTPSTPEFKVPASRLPRQTTASRDVDSDIDYQSVQSTPSRTFQSAQSINSRTSSARRTPSDELPPPFMEPRTPIEDLPQTPLLSEEDSDSENDSDDDVARRLSRITLTSKKPAHITKLTEMANSVVKCLMEM